MGSYFLPRVGVPNNDDRVIGFRTTERIGSPLDGRHIHPPKKSAIQFSALMFTPI